MPCGLAKQAPILRSGTWLADNYGFRPTSTWIAHCEEVHVLSAPDSPYRLGDKRVTCCPPDKQPAIAAAFRHIGMLGPVRQGR